MKQTPRDLAFDVFISYTDADVEHAKMLATSLASEGIQAFLLEWVEEGVIESLAQEDALRTATTGLLIFSPTTMRSSAIQEEYAALLLLARSEAGLRFIPVLVEDVKDTDLPPFAAIRKPVDLRGAVGDYGSRIASLVRVLRRVDARRTEPDAAARQATDVAAPVARSPVTRPRASAEPEGADVVIVTALREEMDAVLAALGEIHIHRLVGRDSYLATVGRLRVAAAVLFGMGNVSAAAAARQAIQVWKPDHLLLVGIAGGFRHSTNDLRLGDVLVADQVIGFELARMTPDGTHRKYELYRPDFDLLTAAKSVAGSEWAPNIMAPRPSGPAGGRTKPEAHFGAVLSGEKVFAYGASIDELRQAWPGAVGVEMESLGVALAAYRGGCGFLMVKGVSDFADETKDDRWRTYAAQAAAHFAAAILRREPIVPR